MSKDHSVHFTGAKGGDIDRDEWATPDWLFKKLDDEFLFTLDPCSTVENRKCPYYFDKQADGLSQDWAQYRAFVNPPYSQLKAWLAKCADAASYGAVVVALIPSRTDTIAWHTYVWDCERHCCRPGVSLRLLKGRVKFVGGASCAPFPSAVVIFRPTP